MGAPGLIVFAVADWPVGFLAWYFFLALTDWLDGKLAVVLHQHSDIGPRLDSVGDVATYGCLLVGLVWLKSEFLWSERAWIVAAVGSYLVTVAIALVKFRCFPSYHTRAAKISWLIVALAVVAVLFDWSAWPLRMGMAMVTFTNVETAAMSLLLPRPLTDVPSIYHALRRDS